MKICKKCNEEKEESEFYKEKSTKDWLRCYCKKCDDKIKTEWCRQKSKDRGATPRYYTLDSREDFEKGIKYCPCCKTKKALSEFSCNKAAKNGIDFHCKECKKELVKKYDSPEDRHERYIKNKCRMRNNKLKKDFGITLEQYNEMLYNQNNRCAICGKHQNENKKALAVDHSHINGKVRELLCGNCNAAVGFVQENSQIARLLANYIDKHKEASSELSPYTKPL